LQHVSPVEKLSHIERAAVAELQALLAQQYGVRDIRLFGSKARGTGHAASDLDLFIVVPNLDWECAKAIYTLCFDLSLRYDLLIAPTLCSQAELENPFVQATPFHRAIQAEGVPV
jgi:predicted nucleotidyltransferase